jgi:hypothetical protein
MMGVRLPIELPMALAQEQTPTLKLPAALYSRGLGRIVDAFLLVCGLVLWVAGALAVLSLTLATIVNLIATGLNLSLPPYFPKVTDPGVASGFLLFGMVFLTLWTAGGIAVGTHLFRSVAGEDRVWLTSEFLVVHRRAWLFRRTTRVARHDIRRISMTDYDRALAVYSSAGMKTITSLGTVGERRELRAALMRQLVLPDAAAVRELEQQTVPPHWETRRADLGYILYRPPARIHGQRVRMVWIVTAVVGLGALTSLVRTIFNGAPLDRLPFLLTGLCAFGAILLKNCRREWVLGAGRLSLRRRFARWLSEEEFEDGVLELSSWVDNDHDVHYALHVSTPYGSRKKIASAVDEPCELYWLAKWLAAHTRFYLDTGNGTPRADVSNGQRPPSDEKIATILKS